MVFYVLACQCFSTIAVVGGSAVVIMANKSAPQTLKALVDAAPNDAAPAQALAEYYAASHRYAEAAAVLKRAEPTSQHMSAAAAPTSRTRRRHRASARAARARPTRVRAPPCLP